MAVSAINISVGSANISVTSISSSNTLGAPALSVNVTIPVTGISSTSSIGSPSVTPGAYTITTSGITSTNSFGTPVFSQTLIIAPAAYENIVLFGVPVVVRTGVIQFTPIVVTVQTTEPHVVTVTKTDNTSGVSITPTDTVTVQQPQTPSVTVQAETNSVTVQQSSSDTVEVVYSPTTIDPQVL